MMHRPVAITAEEPLSKALDNQSITRSRSDGSASRCECVNTRHDCTGRVRIPSQISQDKSSLN